MTSSSVFIILAIVVYLVSMIYIGYRHSKGTNSSSLSLIRAGMSPYRSKSGISGRQRELMSFSERSAESSIGFMTSPGLYKTPMALLKVSRKLSPWRSLRSRLAMARIAPEGTSIRIRQARINASSLESTLRSAESAAA